MLNNLNSPEKKPAIVRSTRSDGLDLRMQPLVDQEEPTIKIGSGVWLDASKRLAIYLAFRTCRLIDELLGWGVPILQPVCCQIPQIHICSAHVFRWRVLGAGDYV